MRISKPLPPMPRQSVLTVNQLAEERNDDLSNSESGRRSILTPLSQLSGCKCHC